MNSFSISLARTSTFLGRKDSELADEKCPINRREQEMSLITGLNMNLILNAAVELMHWSDCLMAFIAAFNTVIIYLLR